MWRPIFFSILVLYVCTKGEKDRNIIDVHDFSLVIPTLEYHNRTWTWHDLLMAMKKDCTNVLVSQVRLAVINNACLDFILEKQVPPFIHPSVARCCIRSGNSYTLLYHKRFFGSMDLVGRVV